MYNYGLRISAIRALDRNHLVLNQPDDWPNGREFRPHLVLRDRPELGGEDDMGLPLKNKGKLADRRVPIRAEDVQVFDLYVSRETPTGAKSSRKKHEEPDKYDLHGLLTTEHSPRISRSTIEDRTAWLTCPTTYSDSECNCRGCREYREDNGQNPPPSRLGRHCEETRSPHQVRHGAITKMLDAYPPETVSKIVGTSVDEIKKTYDRADEIQRMNRLDWEN
jgi:integrase